MSYHKFISVSEERYNILNSRHEKFMEVVDSKEAEAMSVFDPMTPNQVEEIMMIREISMELQKKKDDDMKKTQAAEVTEVVQETDVNGTTEDTEEKTA